MTVTLELPDSLAHEASKGGLLTPQVIEALLREELRRRSAAEFFRIADQLASDGTPPMTADEIQAEIDAARAERRRSRDAGGR